MPSSANDPKAQISPLTMVYGTAPSLRRRVVSGIVDRVLPPSEREWGLTVLDIQEIGVASVLTQLGAVSLMADTRVLVIRNVEKLPAAAQKPLVEGLGRIPDGTTLIIDTSASEDYRKKGPQVCAALRKLFEERGQLIEAAAPSDRDLPAWVMDEMRARGKTMSSDAARAFVQTVGPSVEMMINEIEKLVTYVGPERSGITGEDVRQVVTGEQESTVFDLVDAIGRRDARTALSVLPDLLPASGVQGAAMPLLAMIARQLRLVWQARVLAAARVPLDTATPPEGWVKRLPGDHNFFEVTKGRRFLTGKYADQARNFSDVQLVRALTRVYETDLALKGQGKERLDDRLALETLIVSLCTL